MTAHFVITISANKKMELQAEVLIRSIKERGGCPDSFFTIFTHESKKISNTYIKKHEIIGYEQNPNLKYPWSVCARWNIFPRSDLIIGMDSDVVALKDLNPLLEQLKSKKGIFGTIADAFAPPILNTNNFSIEKWKELFNLAGINFPKDTYTTSSGKTGSPYYINNGVVALSSEYLPEMRIATKKMIEMINSKCYNDYFITQRATTLAAYACKVPLNVMPKEFNHLEFSYGQPNKNTYFFHYNVSKDRRFFNPTKFISKKILL